MLRFNSIFSLLFIVKGMPAHARTRALSLSLSLSHTHTHTHTHTRQLTSVLIFDHFYFIFTELFTLQKTVKAVYETGARNASLFQQRVR